MAKGSIATLKAGAPTRRPSPMLGIDRALVGLYGALLPGAAAASFERFFLTPGRILMPETAYRFFTNTHATGIPYRDSMLYLWCWAPRDAVDPPTIVVLHDWGGRAAEFHRFIGPLVGAGFRVAAFDGPAHGFSDGRHSSLVDFAGAVSEVARLCGPVHGVLAHSLGAAAVALAMTHDLETRSLVFLAPALSWRTVSLAAARGIGMPMHVHDRMQARVEARFGVAWKALETDRLIAAATARAEVPLLVFHDRDDPDVPWDDARRIAAAAPESQLVTTTGLGHHRLLTDSFVVEDTVAFFLGGWPDEEGIAA